MELFRPISGQSVVEYLRGSNDYLAVKEMPNNWYAAIIRLTFGRARIIVGYNHLCYEDSW
jgi:hypothetical protein